METNYFGMIYCTKNFLPYMIEQGEGHIVNVASVGASLGVPGVASYCATKFAMLGFSEGLKHELSGTGVDLTVVSPIMVDTPLFDHPSFENFSRRSTIVILSPEKVANAVLKAAKSSKLEIRLNWNPANGSSLKRFTVIVPLPALLIHIVVSSKG